METAGKIFMGMVVCVLVLSVADACLSRSQTKKKEKKNHWKPIPEFKGNVVNINLARKLRK